MNNSNSNPVKRPQRFLWHGLLIVVPILVLATAGFLSLRADRVLARHEADERAHALAGEMTRSLWAILTNVPTALVHPETASRFIPEPNGLLPPPSFAINATGELHFPPPLSSRKADDGSAVLQPLEEAGKSKVQGDYAALINTAASNLVYAPTILTTRLLAKLGEMESRLEVKGSGPSASGRSGGRVAAWQRLWIQHELLRDLYARTKKQFALDAEGSVALPRVFWVQSDEASPGVDWLARRIHEDIQTKWFVLEAMTPTHSWSFPVAREIVDEFSFGGTEIVTPHNRRESRSKVPTVTAWHRVQPGAFVVATINPSNGVAPTALDELSRTVRQYTEHLPGYLGISLDVGGRTLISSNSLMAVVQTGASGGKGGPHWEKVRLTEPPETLVVAGLVVEWQAGTIARSSEMLRVGVHLVSPALLYARQQSRSFMFGSVIALAALTALMGFASSRRAFRRQQHLAEMKSNFVSSVSHELRAPIASVRLMAESLERGGVIDETKQQEYFRLIGQECRRLSSLIENVLDFSRIEQGRKDYHVESTDLETLLTKTMQLMEPSASARRIQLRFTPTGPAVPVEADGRALQQALVNLIDNSLKHSPAGSTVTLGLEFPDNGSADEAPLFIQLWVEDQGEGIPPEEQERIFDRFYRCGSELRRTTEGVGIGLSIVQHIVTAHGGTVTVRSAVGSGSRFTIHLPVKSASFSRQT